METSTNGLAQITLREGSKLNAYQDVKGIWTIGVGHTGPEVGPGLIWTPSQVTDALSSDVSNAEDAVNTVTQPLTQNQFDALVSFVFNVGVGAFNSSTMKRLLNAGDYTGASQQFNRWVIPASITGRRMTEKAQFLQA